MFRLTNIFFPDKKPYVPLRIEKKKEAVGQDSFLLKLINYLIYCTITLVVRSALSDFILTKYTPLG
jgi:hypothetical protein